MKTNQTSRWPEDASALGAQFLNGMERALDAGNREDAQLWSRQVQHLIAANGSYRGEPTRERWLDLTERLYTVGGVA
jgi:hypothetical protein